MKVTYDIEYLNQSGDYDVLEVEFEGQPEWVDDSFDYAGTHCTGGRGGTHHIPKYLSMQDSEITWNTSNFMGTQNVIIKNWLSIESNREQLEEYFIEQFKQLNQ